MSLRVGRSKEADTLRAEVAARSRYLYAVMDTAAMTQADLKAVGEYLAAITNATVLVADASGFSDAKSLYAALKADGSPAGWNSGSCADFWDAGHGPRVPGGL